MQLEDTIDENGRTHSGAKTTYKSYVTVTQTNLLEQTDWMLVRKKERNISVPSSVTTKRSAITTEATRLKTAIDSATTEAQVITAFQSASWPEDN
jgi:hypothetical protein